MAGTALPLFANNALTPMTLRYLEDFRPGERFETGTMTLTEEAIYAFAREFDPQTFHLIRWRHAIRYSKA